MQNETLQMKKMTSLQLKRINASFSSNKMNAVLLFSIIAFGYMTPFAIILRQRLGQEEMNGTALQ